MRKVSKQHWILEGATLNFLNMTFTLRGKNIKLKIFMKDYVHDSFLKWSFQLKNIKMRINDDGFNFQRTTSI